MNGRGVRLAVCVALASVGATLLAGCDGLVSKPSLYGAVAVRVERRDGSAVPGSRLVLYTGQRPMAYGVSDASGSYFFARVPEGLYGVRADPPAGYIGSGDLLGGPDTEVRESLQVHGGDTVAVRFDFLKLGTGSIVARVVQPDGQPLPRVAVALYASSGVVQRGVTDTTGAYAFDAVPAGNYGVFALRTAFYRDSGESAQPSRDGILVEEGTRDTTSFLFASCTGTLTATVRDNRGAVVPTALLTFYGSITAQAVTLAADGTHVFSNIGCGQYGLRVTAPTGWTAPDTEGASFIDGLSVHRGSTLSALLTILRVGRGTIRARVVDDAGMALPSIRVVVYTGEGLVRDLLTDAEGTVTASDLLIDRPYGVRVVPRAGYTVAEAAGASFFDQVTLADGGVRNVVFTLKRD